MWLSVNGQPEFDISNYSKSNSGRQYQRYEESSLWIYPAIIQHSKLGKISNDEEMCGLSVNGRPELNISPSLLHLHCLALASP